MMKVGFIGLGTMGARPPATSCAGAFPWWSTISAPTPPGR